MKKGLIALGAAFFLSVTPVIASSNFEEPKDSFVLFGWRLYSDASAVVHLESKPKLIASKPKPQPKVIAITQTAPTSSWNVAKASQYGGSDGFYYGHFACGGKYLPSVVGVAHKTIRCGTLITFKYYGTKIINHHYVRGWYTATIRVVDRGPYCCGRSWDFTVAAATSLGFNGIGTVYWKYAK